MNDLGGFTPVIDETGEITGYKTTIGGADTVFPFRKSKYVMGSVYFDANTTKTINLGFKPDYLIAYYIYSSSDSVSCIYNSDKSTTTYARYGSQLSFPKLPNTSTGGKLMIHSINDDGFTIFANKNLNVMYFALIK